jgi:hypothetical protein
MNIEKSLDRIHKLVTSNSLLQIFTAFTRALLAFGFIPPSISKIMHQPFTILSDSDPVGHYFNALYQTGFYYQFIGWSQIIAAILLLIPRTSHLGALMFFPIILNITVLTNSVGFKGTWLLTIMMLIACMYLVFWDYDRWKSIVFGKRTLKANFIKYELIWLPLLFALGGLSFSFLLAFSAVGNIKSTFIYVALVISSVGLLFGFVVSVHHKFMRIGPTKTNNNYGV